jgi:hypothetical protein
MSWRRRGREACDRLGLEDEEAIAAESWEYLVEEGDVQNDRLERRCNELGAEGWELVAAIPLSRLALSAGGRTTGILLFFKRRLP